MSIDKSKATGNNIDIDSEAGVIRDTNGYISIKFQRGDPLTEGINGTNISEVINLLMFNLGQLSETDMVDTHNAYAIYELERVLKILNDRMHKRLDLGVFGNEVGSSDD